MEKTVQRTYGQPGSMEYILRSQIARSPGGLVKMAPGTAKRILEELNFQGQRKVESRRVYGHAYAIKSGDWVEDYPIHFVAMPDGRIWLVDGQHRLTAISEQQQPIGVTIRLVELESEKQARHFYAGFDKKDSVRTNTQILDAIDLARETGLTSRMARAVFEAAPILLNDMEPVTGSKNVKQFPHVFLQQTRIKAVFEYVKEAKEYESIIKVAAKGLLEKLKQTGPVAMGLYTLRHQPAKAREFWAGIANNDGLRRADPRATLISDYLVRSFATGSTRQRVQQTSLAWNAFCEGRDLKIIKCLDGAVLTIWGTPLKAGRK